MNRFLIIGFMLSLISINSHAANATFPECVSYAAELNKYFPQMADKVTKVEATACLPDKKRVILMYSVRLLISKQEASNYSMIKLKKSFIQTWCTTPDQRQLLEALDIRYNYLDKSGVFIDNIDIKISDCKN